MSKQETLKKIRQYIADTKLEKAINHLEELNFDTQIGDELLLLTSRINLNEQKQHLGILDHSSYSIEKNKITIALLEITRKVGATIPNINPTNEIEDLKEILDLLEMTSKIVKVQRRLRKKIVSEYFDELSPDELNTHKTIRGFSKDVIKKHNYKILHILQKNPILQDKISNLETLELHLVLWKSKFESTFHDDESIAWVYTGIDEGVGFPNGIEEEIKNYLEK